MRKLEWQQIIQASADPQRAKHGFDQLKATNAAGPLRQASPEEARILAALFSGSQALGQLLLKHPDWLPQTLDAELLRHPRQEQGLRREVNGWLEPLLRSRDYANTLTRLRLFKQREMLRIAARDLARLGNTTEIMREISDVADVCLDAVYQVCRHQFTERFGLPYHLDAEGRWHSGVLEQSWRIGGASGPEVAALEAFRADPALRAVRAWCIEAYGADVTPPSGAITHFCGVDEKVGCITKYTLVERYVAP